MSTNKEYFKEMKDIWSEIRYEYSDSPAKNAFDMFFNISSEICRLARVKKISNEEFVLFEIWVEAFNHTADSVIKENKISEKTHDLLIRMKNFLATYRFENLSQSFNL